MQWAIAGVQWAIAGVQRAIAGVQRGNAGVQWRNVLFTGLLAASTLAPAGPSAGSPANALPGAPPFPKPLRERLLAALAASGPEYVPRTKHRLADGSPRYTNRLILETSPYLRQHAHNPVNWYPWGEEAFAEARRQDLPVLVSIGYSTCHWCHVMEEESFDDPELAALLNESFVAIKVDREVRPDVDAVYMTAIRAMGQNGGWPLNVFVTPDRKPFFAGTYFPPADRGGRRGFPSVLRALRDAYREERVRVSGIGEQWARAVRSELERAATDSTRAPDAVALDAAFASSRSRFDAVWGGAGRAPKFPSSLPVRLLLRRFRVSGDPDALHMAVLSLEKTAAGGIHDQLGGGFHRYATDRRWLVPHFEKMLYDNALRAVEYLEGWQTTGREDFAQVVRSTLDYLLREMRAPGGGFYSATDADSLDPHGESEEGRFFSWTPDEIRSALDGGLAAVAIAYFGVTAAGNYEGRTVLHAWRDPDDLVPELGIDATVVAQRLAEARLALRAARDERPPPLRDEKVLVAWNGLVLSALARAGFALGQPRYVEAAVVVADFLLGEMRRDGRLLRVYQAGRASGPAFLEDYAFLEAGLLDLYEAAPDPRWLREALALQTVLDARYGDDAGGGYFRSAADAEHLLAREKPASDGAIPSGNSVAAMNLLRLAELTGQQIYAERADRLFSAFRGEMERDPGGLSELLLALDFRVDRPKEIVVVRPAAEEGGLAKLIAPLRRTFVPNRVIAVVAEGSELQAHAAVVPLVAGKLARGGRATAYVCENRVCHLPTTDPGVFAQQLVRVAPPE